MSGLTFYDGFIDVKEVARKLGRSVTYVWTKLRDDPTFPRPAWRRPKDTKWRASDVDIYILGMQDALAAAELRKIVEQGECRAAV